MNSEPFFLVDEELVEVEHILKDLEFRIDNPDLEKNQMILRTFVSSCMQALQKPKPLPPPIPLKIQKKEQKKLKKEQKKIIKEIKKIPKAKRIFPVPKPKGSKIESFKTKTKFRRQETERELEKTQIPLIQDTITKKLVALADLNDKYVVREPPIEKDEIKILREIIKKRPESPKQAWLLLKDLGKGLSDDKLTNIKYYMINSIFALGRIEPLLHDKEIQEIVCEGVGKFITIKRDNQWFKTNIIFNDKEDIESYMKKLAKRFDKSLEEKNPVLDLVHRDFRFHFILGLHGASSKFTIKRIE